ncbi:unnamed protein product [Ostreobium quekettii]|uniref:Uncharacterized protein n=1 Tax=Ostreobium quekettii TaxID=121088 RepID=A0A8S1IY23_9CHLO|nr:unnamed protein product [Ostreobium quekettii]|eukprot:evm.model.scf_599.7 EVM.evm.TU.scf_599.7   scf_599:38986-41806(+)
MASHAQLASSSAKGACRCHPALPMRKSCRAGQRGMAVRVRGEQGSSSRGPFDEGAAQVKRLVNRDRANFSGKGFERLLEEEFEEGAEGGKKAEDQGNGASSSTREPSSATDSSKAAASFKLRSSPFSAPGLSGSNPFGPGSSSSPFGMPESGTGKEDMKNESDEPWWAFVKKITLTQVVLFCTFSSMLGLMVGTFLVVYNSGAVHFNE